MGAFQKLGGGGRNRTGVDGFAGRCITTLLPRHRVRCDFDFLKHTNDLQLHHEQKRKHQLPLGNPEHEDVEFFVASKLSLAEQVCDYDRSAATWQYTPSIQSR